MKNELTAVFILHILSVYWFFVFLLYFISRTYVVHCICYLRIKVLIKPLDETGFHFGHSYAPSNNLQSPTGWVDLESRPLVVICSASLAALGKII